jgi:hypothetical protein
MRMQRLIIHSHAARSIDFFSILVFLIIILEINLVKHFFKITILNRTNSSDATYEEVVTVHLARLKGLACA